MADIGKLGSMRQAPPQRVEYGPEDVTSLSTKELYGHDEPRFTVSLDDRSKYVSKAVKILADAREPNSIIPICSAFLERFKIKRAVNNRNNFFAGELGARNLNEAKNLKFAVLKLLGVNNEDAKHIFGYAHLDGLSFSASYDMDVKGVQEDRDLFPLKNPDSFPNIKSALAEIKKYTDLPVEEIFQTGRIPPTSSWMKKTVQQPKLLLHEALSILGVALMGSRTYRDVATQTHKPFEVVERLLTRKTNSPFTDAIRTLLRTQREKYQEQHKKIGGS